jgi:hypothetical protein
LNRAYPLHFLRVGGLKAPVPIAFCKGPMIHRVYNSTKHSKSHPITFRVGQTGNSQPHVSKRCAAHILTRFFPAIGSGLDIVLSGALITSSKAAVILRGTSTHSKIATTHSKNRWFTVSSSLQKRQAGSSTLLFSKLFLASSLFLETSHRKNWILGGIFSFQTVRMKTGDST